MDLNISKFKDELLKTKKYWFLYIAFIVITTLAVITENNIVHPKFELMTLAIMVILGVLCIVYYLTRNSDKELYKVAFIVILCFGIVTAFILPLSEVSDESEHITRAEITSRGDFFPHWTGDDMGLERTFNVTEGKFSNVSNPVGFHTIQSITLFNEQRGITVFETQNDTDKINHDDWVLNSAFQQNPFYGYLPQALGILFAKLLDLNVIWMLWLGRIFNLVCYAGLVAFAIKKTDYLKMPLLAVSCMPIAIYQSASISIDSMIFGLGIVCVSYFIHFCTSNENSIDIKEIFIFSGLCLLLGLCKLPYLAFVFLLLFIPFENFKNSKNTIYTILLCIAAVGLIGVIYSRFSTPTLLHSWRSSYNLVNSTLQLNYLTNHPVDIIHFIKKIFTHDLFSIVNGVYCFYDGVKSHIHYQNYSYIITLLIQLFMIIVLFAYPNNPKFKLKSRIGALIVLLIIYVGTCFIQLLTWANVGKMELGISLRYFLPLIALLPIIINFKTNIDKNKFNNYAFVFIISFMATLILTFAIKYY